MRKCPYCGHAITDEQFAEIMKAKGAAGGRAKTERKKAAGARNMEKARAAISPERRAEILAKATEAARKAREAKKAGNDTEKQD